tara:strand:- start:2604 stop:3557 length:954 start_codon:yes stop_codon:yes gene_type:complete
MKKTKVFVSSRSFSSNSVLKKKLLSIYPNSTFNNLGRRLNHNEFIQYAKNSEKIIVALDKIDQKVLKFLPNLKVISKYGVGLDNLSLKDLDKFNIKLGWSNGHNSRAVAELVIAYIFSISRDLYNYQKSLKLLRKFKQNISKEVSSKKIGIIGFGSIGSEVAKLLSPLKCKIFFNDIRKVITSNKLYEQKSLNYILRNSDIITIHTPLTKKTINLLNDENIFLCKKDSIIINCARGGIVNERSLYKFLNKNKLASAAFDVFNNEPPTKSNLLNLGNFYCTPHIGGSTSESIINMGLSAISGLDNYINLNKLYKYGYE